MKAHSNLLVLLHWLLVPAILAALFMGNDIASLSNDLDLKVDRVKVHMLAGIFIGGLFVIRLIVKITSDPIAPIQGSESTPVMNKLATLTHRALYLLVFLIVLTGIGMALQTNMWEVIQYGETIPDYINELPARRAHGVLTSLLAILILVHTIAALFHHFILKDGLMSRMWFHRNKNLSSDE
ncbi:cytochrome b/b6 domain-containing protein [Pseudoalteromonas sp. MMG024]|uniref:cytochrome b n=1 Tax=Pseudoalteromonas sp. MMG024 TaxID=2909980 RepID=UPI001EFF7ACE|nr:cytochrome b/b6 domain-containing protein [Pseudoalteromonas sp. MMG024]MCF6458153.1 cytochrome b/b6 domain-containing protein [Pseudoalteromonas sp. MMG024]